MIWKTVFLAKIPLYCPQILLYPVIHYPVIFQSWDAPSRAVFCSLELNKFMQDQDIYLFLLVF